MISRLSQQRKFVLDQLSAKFEGKKDTNVLETILITVFFFLNDTPQSFTSIQQITFSGSDCEVFCYYGQWTNRGGVSDLTIL